MNKTYVLISLILSLGILGSAVITTNAKKEMAKTEYDRQLNIMRMKEAKIRDCEFVAYQDYNLTWNTACEARGLPNNCLLPGGMAESYNRALKESKDRCHK